MSSFIDVTFWVTGILLSILVALWWRRQKNYKASILQVIGVGIGFFALLNLFWVAVGALTLGVRTLF